MAKNLLQTIIVNQPIAGLNLPYTNCTTLLDVLTALAASGGGDVSAVGGVYDPVTESLVISLSNGGTFSIPVAALLPVMADGTTITGNGTTADPLVGYSVTYDVTTREITIATAAGVVLTVPAPSALNSTAVDTFNLLGGGLGAEVSIQQLLDLLVLQVQGATTEIPFYAFVDPTDPTEVEAQAWIDGQGQRPAGTIFIYGTDITGNEDPDYVWIMNGIGDAINVESPVALGEGVVGGGGPPTPYNSGQAAFFLDPATSGLYVWSPSTVSWFGPYLPN